MYTAESKLGVAFLPACAERSAEIDCAATWYLATRAGAIGMASTAMAVPFCEEVNALLLGF